MRYLIIGSHAMKYYGFDRTPNDFDIIADFDSAVEYMKRNNAIGVRPLNGGKTLVGRAKSGIIEISIAWPGSTNAELLGRTGFRLYATKGELLALKLSHRYLRNSPHFLKTMRDIRELRDAGVELSDWQRDWLKRREKETYAYKHPNLAQSKQGFFSGDGVQYVHDHDSIHEAVAILETGPVYKLYQKEGSEVLCDKAKWDALPFWLKLQAVAEETAVLAIERSLVPYPGLKTPWEAYLMALEKVCTSITSGWFREFAWENYDAIVAHGTDYAFWEFFQNALQKGEVKPYASSS